MSNKFVIAYDLGTTGNKATIFNDKGELKASTFVGYETYYPDYNWAEQDPEDWWNAVCQATKELLAKGKVEAKDVACISFSGQMMGCVAVTKDIRPVRKAIIWADQRAVGQTNELIVKLGQEKIYQITGHRPSPSYSAAKIMWLRDMEEVNFKETYKVLHAKDFIVARLTGNFVTDYSDASGMNLFDIKQLKWSQEILAAADLAEGILPDPHASTDVVGYVQHNIAEVIGLLAGTPVVIGGGDGSCAAAGAGVIKEGSAYNYVGSSSWIGIATGEPIYDPQMRTFNWVHVVPGLYSPTGTMQAAGASYQWLRDNICLEEVRKANDEGISPYTVMDNEAAMVAAGSDNLIYLPYLIGERSPRWNPLARGTLIGLTIKHTKAHIIRAFMEGVAYNLKVILEAFLEQGASIKAIRLIGGGAKGQVWPQIMADVYEVPILKAAYQAEATSLGAAVTGGVGVGLFSSFNVIERMVATQEVVKPNPDNSHIYRHLYRIFNKAYCSLEEIFGDLAEG